MAQLVKNLPATWETRVRSLGWEDALEKVKAAHLWIRSLGLEDPLEKEMVTHYSILAWVQNLDSCNPRFRGVAGGKGAGHNL